MPPQLKDFVEDLRVRFVAALDRRGQPLMHLYDEIGVNHETLRRWAKNIHIWHSNIRTLEAIERWVLAEEAKRAPTKR